MLVRRINTTNSINIITIAPLSLIIVLISRAPKFNNKNNNNNNINVNVHTININNKSSKINNGNSYRNSSNNDSNNIIPGGWTARRSGGPRGSP